MNRKNVTGHDRYGMNAVVLVVVLLFSSGCERTPAHNRVTEENPPAMGGTVAGLIVRDAQTRSDIAATAATTLPKHDATRGPLSLVVTKSRYRLDLLLRDTRIKTYPVALGGSPSGHKQRQGDSRTPEGEYLLFPHHPSPSFGGVFYVAYPNETDALRGFATGREALGSGVDPVELDRGLYRDGKRRSPGVARGVRFRRPAQVAHPAVNCSPQLREPIYG